MLERNVARTIKLTKSSKNNEKKTIHKSFSEKDMAYLWSKVDELDTEAAIIIQCYSGWRPDELCKIKIEDVDLENWIFYGGSKTSNGINRPVPIHSKIRKYVKNFYDEAIKNNLDTLISVKDSRNGFNKEKRIKLSYSTYKYRFSKLSSSLEIRHHPHDARLHFVTMSKKYKLDEYAIKYIVGHAISDLTENIYTDRDVSWLREEIEKIK